MARSRSLELLERLLAGDQLEAHHLDTLITQRVVEDLHIDYKEGDLLKNESQSQKTIREYVSAFANSAGGILIVGIKESGGVPQEITGCKGHTKDKLDDWASRCLTSIASYLVPPPRIQVVDHPNGQVLVCAVQRSLSLVPFPEKNGGIIYHFRLGDQTLKAPDYLMADVLLGRRQQPIFQIEELKALNFTISPGDNIGSEYLLFDLRFRIENISIVWADDSKCGIIYWSDLPNRDPYYESGKPSQYLSSYLEISEETFEPLQPKQLVHTHRPAGISKPFDVGNQLFSFGVPLRVRTNTWLAYTWKVALYFLARNSLPTWYQIEFDIDESVRQLATDQKVLIPPNDKFRIRKLTTERPIVAWEEKSRVEIK
jgi:hypothetical protein